MSTEQAEQQIQQFLAAIKRVLFMNRLKRLLCISALLAASLATVAALIWIINGYQVPVAILIGVYALVCGVALVLAIVQPVTTKEAAQAADASFGLDDHLMTACGIDGKDGFSQLQKIQAAERIADSDISLMRQPLGMPLQTMTVLAMVISIALAFVPEAEYRTTEKIIAQKTLEDTTAISKFIEERVEELLEDAEDLDLSDEEREQLEEIIEKMEGTENEIEALRQYAEVDQMLQDMQQRMGQEENEALLREAGEAMTQDEQTKALGKNLQQQEFDQAKERLENMAPKEGEEDLAAQRRQLDRLKKAAQHLKEAAAKQQQANKSKANKSAKQSQHNAQSGKQSQGKQNGQNQSQQSQEQSQDQDGQLSKNIQELAKQIQEYDKNLKKCENQKKQTGKCDKKSLSACKSSAQQCSSALAKLGKSLQRMSASKKSGNKLGKLRQQLNQCSSCLGQSQGQSLAQSLQQMRQQSQSKGKGIGSEAGDKTSNPNQFTDPGTGEQLAVQGQKGSGPSTTQIEAAESGTGVASQRGRATKHTFSHKFESFVEREDIPEDVKQGVKEYFKNIHKGE